MALALLFASGALVAGVQGQARALASRPPDAVLKQENRVLQDGRLISYCWIDRCVDGFSRYPSAVAVDPGSRLHIRLSENRRPDRFSLMGASPRMEGRGGSIPPSGGWSEPARRWRGTSTSEWTARTATTT